VTDHDWYPSPYVNEYRRGRRIDDSIYGVIRALDGR
jgi:hypothetical protein